MSELTKRQIELLHLVESGIVSALACPACEQPSGEVWFSHVDGEYRFWFRCDACGYEFSGQYNERPAAFTDDRISAIYQARHEALRRNARFPWPNGS